MDKLQCSISRTGLLHAPYQTNNTVVYSSFSQTQCTINGVYLCRDGLESFEFGLLYLHLGTVPVLFVSFFLICHPYMSVILEQNVFILVDIIAVCKPLEHFANN